MSQTPTALIVPNYLKVGNKAGKPAIIAVCVILELLVRALREERRRR